MRYDAGDSHYQFGRPIDCGRDQLQSMNLKQKGSLEHHEAMGSSGSLTKKRTLYRHGDKF